MAPDKQDGRPNTPPQHVAVIAVHGVGYTEPCATADHLADVLLGLGRHQLDASTSWPPPDASTPYRAFAKTPIVVPLQRPHIQNRAAAKSRFQDHLQYVGRSLLHAWDERLGYLADAFASPKKHQPVIEREVHEDHGKIGYEFMRTQLAGYIGEDDGKAFDTTRLEGERVEPGLPPQKVHIYEAYWADLARPQNSIVSFFMAFYQLLFHLGSLSRTAVYYATVEHISDWRWRTVSFLQAFSSRVLVIPIPILNLVLLLVGLSVLPLKIPEHPLHFFGFAFGTRALAAALIGGLIALAAILFLRSLRAIPRTPLQWVLVLGFAFAAVSAVSFWFACGSTSAADTVLAFEWWALGAALISTLLQRYELVRRSAWMTGMALVLAGFLGFCCSLYQARGRDHYLENGSFWTIVLVMAALILCWAALLSSALLLWVFNGICLLSKMPNDQRGRAHAALRTGRLTLAVSASGFLLATIFLWAGIFKYGAERAELYSGYTPTAPSAGWVSVPINRLVPTPAMAADWMQRFGTLPQAPQVPLTTAGPAYNPNNEQFRAYVRTLLLIAVTSGLPLMLVLSAAALVCLAWAVLPSLLSDRKTLHLARNSTCTTMGNWLSQGLDSTKAVAGFAWHSIFTVAAIFGVLDLIACRCPALKPDSPHWSWLWQLVRWNTQATLKLVDTTATLFALSGAAILALILKYGKTPLDIILDVDNYLRTSPLDDTPRARIAERYISLLRYVASQKRADGAPFYDSIVIGAHSLGALISVDLLAFLTREGDPDLAALGLAPGQERKQRSIKISLLTFGNPVRQLLNRFFPHLYWWVNDTPDNSVGPLPQGVAEAENVTHSATPALSLLTLEHWVNLYRSGDFIGRPVWLNNWYNRTDSGPEGGPYPDPIQIFAPLPNASEGCVGLGGHNDYWNRTAPDLAQRLDVLISS
jgi:hypothetical protein